MTTDPGRKTRARPRFLLTMFVLHVAGGVLAAVALILITHLRQEECARDAGQGACRHDPVPGSGHRVIAWDKPEPGHRPVPAAFAPGG